MAAVVIARYLPLGECLPPCTFKKIAGIPCPTCGTGRALAELAQGNVASAVIMNPLFSLIMLFAAGVFLSSIIMTIFPLPKFSAKITDRQGNILLIAGISLLLINWAYLVIECR